jgi:hypothetical protein
MTVGTHTDLLVIAVIDQLHATRANWTLGDIAGLCRGLGGDHVVKMLTGGSPHINKKDLVTSSIAKV